MACCALEKGINGREVLGTAHGILPLQALHELCLQRSDQELLLLWQGLMQARPKVTETVGALFYQEPKKVVEKEPPRASNGEATREPEKIAPLPEVPEKEVVPPPPAEPTPPPEPVVVKAPEVLLEVEEAPVPSSSPSSKSLKPTSGLRPRVEEPRYVNGCLPLPEKDSAAGKLLARLQALFAPIMNNAAFKILLILCVVAALFGGGLATLANIPDDPGTAVVDVIMLTVTGIFTFEIIGNCIVEYRHYPLSFFFWMDLVGTISMIFEVSFLLGTAGKMQTSESSGSLDTVVMRTARAAKVGARAGRLSKLLKYFDPKPDEANVEAKVLSSKLTLTLSTRVSMLTILLVMVLPLFESGQYPEIDLSMESWTEQLELSLQRAYDDQLANPVFTSREFQYEVERLVDFYSTVSYKPYKLEGFGIEIDAETTGTMRIVGSDLLDQPEPIRKSNVYVQEVKECRVLRESCNGDRRAKVFFDFKVPKQFEAGADICMVLFVVLCMVLICLVLNYTLDKLIIQPMERMLTTVITLAGDILKQFGMDDDMEGDGNTDETHVIEIIFRKFARLASLAAQRNELSAEDLKDLDDESRGVMLQMMNVQQKKVQESPQDKTELKMNVKALATLPVAKSVVESWNFDVLELSAEQNAQVAMHLLFDSNLGRITGRTWTKPETFIHFHDAAQKKYNDLPYHNYAHAIDVLHTVYRFLNLCHTSQWLSNVEQYALLIAALCHDLGHQGKTNQFLVETRDQLALTYNDRSPLENMHAATMFEIASVEDTDIFKKMDMDAKKLARKVAIAAILHTDNANHYDMVKETARIHEIGADFCEAQARCPDGEFDLQYMEQILQKNTLTWIELFLHFADVSNSTKPFKTCHAWAWRVLDEFFDQGDAEKQLGIPVGMLNDREKVNRPGSQHGFINFMVAPLVLNAVKLFPVLHPVYTQMANNLEQWRNIWMEDVKPGAEEIAKKDADVQKIKTNAAEMEQRAAQW